MGIPLGPADFTRGAAKPLDDSFIQADATARDAIASGIRYEGMLVYVVTEQVMYQLQGGITNSDWIVAGGGGSSTPIRDKFAGDGVTTGFTLTQDPGSEDNTMVFVGGVYQEKTEYYVSGPTLTLAEAPPTGVSVEVITGGTSTVNVPAADSVTMTSMALKVVHATAAPLGGVLSTASCGSQTGITLQTDITNATGTLVSKGRPVMIALMPIEHATDTGQIDILAADTRSYIVLFRNGSQIQKMQFGNFINDPGLVAFRSECQSMMFIDVAAPAGTNTYKLAILPAVGATAVVLNMHMIAFET